MFHLSFCVGGLVWLGWKGFSRCQVLAKGFFTPVA